MILKQFLDSLSDDVFLPTKVKIGKVERNQAPVLTSTSFVGKQSCGDFVLFCFCLFPVSKFCLMRVKRHGSVA